MVNTCIPMYRNTTVSVGVRGGERGGEKVERRREEGEEERLRGRGKEGRRGEGGGYNTDVNLTHDQPGYQVSHSIH